MKRMSEVFKLPVQANQIYVSPNLIENGKMDDAGVLEVLTHAAHAINRVDALADALSYLINCVHERGIGDDAASEYAAFCDAKEVLAAYRGGK